MTNIWLAAAGIMSATAALVHLGCIAAGARWYRFFGAGERLALLVEQKSVIPTLITGSIAGMLALWAAYAFAGAGFIPQLPYGRAALAGITAIYLLRGLALPLMLRTMPELSPRFLVISSIIVLAIGVTHAIGLAQGWDQMA
jgi:hypothetical protein